MGSWLLGSIVFIYLYLGVVYKVELLQAPERIVWPRPKPLIQTMSTGHVNGPAKVLNTMTANLLLEAKENKNKAGLGIGQLYF